MYEHGFFNFSEKTQPGAVGVKFDPFSPHIPMAEAVKDLGV